MSPHFLVLGEILLIFHLLYFSFIDGIELLVFTNLPFLAFLQAGEKRTNFVAFFSASGEVPAQCFFSDVEDIIEPVMVLKNCSAFISPKSVEGAQGGS